MKMSKQTFVFLISIFWVFLSSCTGNTNKKVQKDTVRELTSVEVSIKGMTCTGCEQTIQTAVSTLDGIQHIKASHIDGKAIVIFDKALTDSIKIKEKINGKGYIATKVTEVPAITITN